MGAVLVAVAVPVGLVLLLLAVPVDVAFRLDGPEALRGQITVRWLLGLVRLRRPVPGAPGPPPAPGTGVGARRRRTRRGDRGRPARIAAVLRQDAFRRRAFRFVRDLVRAVGLRRLRLRLRLGLDDPADTGRLWALVGSLNALVPYPPGAIVQLEPEFREPSLEFHADGRLVLVPLRFLILAVAFALSPSSIRAWRTLGGSHA